MSIQNEAPHDLREVRLTITAGWLVEEVDEHTCGTDRDGYYGHHEPGCGQIPVMQVAELVALFDTLTGLGIPINRAPQELAPLLAKLRAVEKLIAFYDRHEYATLNVDDLRDALAGGR